MYSSGTRIQPWGLPVQPNNIPSALKEHDRWLLWQAYHRAPNKVDKRPIGKRGALEWTQPKNMFSFEKALEKLESGRYNGLGFAPLLKDNLIFIDIDNCFIGN